MFMTTRYDMCALQYHAEFVCRFNHALRVALLLDESDNETLSAENEI